MSAIASFLRRPAPGTGTGSALQVAVLWGEQDVLHVAQLAPPRPFSVGDDVSPAGLPATDFAIGHESLGTSRLPLVSIVVDGPAVVVPEGAALTLTRGGQLRSLAELEAAGELAPCAELPGARQYRLREGESARVSYRGFDFVLGLDAAVPRSAVGAGAAQLWDRKATRYTFASFALHLGVLLLFQLMPPRSSALSYDIDGSQSRLTSYLIEQQENTLDPLGGLEPATEQPGGEPSAPRAAGDQGQAGEPKRKERRPAVATAKTRAAQLETPPLSREAIASSGILAALRSASPLAAGHYDRAAALAVDADEALGMLLAGDPGGGFGVGGLGMAGTGRGGGQAARGTIGVGGLGTISGPGGPGGPGQAGWGMAGGNFKPRPPRVPPRIGVGDSLVRGALSKEVIRRVIQRHLSEVRYCYEEGLRSRPDLQGRVAVRFMIDPSGIVRMAARESSSLGAPKVDQCITTAVQRWLFPAPDGGGTVIVTYPFVLQQVAD